MSISHTNWTRRFHYSFVFLIFFCGFLAVAEDRIINAEDTGNAKEIYQNVSPELRIKIDEWMKLLYSDDPTIRSSAIISLLGLEIPNIYDALIVILRNSEKDDVRISLIKAFGFSGGDKALDCMVELLASKKEAIRNASADALGSMKTRRAIKKMIEILQGVSQPVNSRVLIADALANTHSREAVEPLIDVLDSKNSDLSNAARNALVEITKQSDGKTKQLWEEWWERNKVKTREQWLEDIIDELENDLKKLKVRNSELISEIAQKTIKVLEARKEKDDIRQIVDATKSPYHEVRYFAAKELAKYPALDVIKIFMNLISDGNVEVRVLAAKTLGDFGELSGLESLKLALKDKEIKVRESAARAMGKLGDKVVFDLLPALKDKESSVISTAAEALGESGASEAVEPLINLLSNKDPKIRESAIVAMGNIKGDRMVEPLINSLGDKEERVKWYAADSLGKIGAKRAVGPLISLLSDESARVRESAVAALGQIGEESAIGPLLKLLQDKDERVADKTADILLSIECKNFALLDRIVNSFSAQRDDKRTIEILNKQISIFKYIPEYSKALWQNKLKLAKLYYSDNNWEDALLLYEELVQHFEDEIGIKHELVHCLKETDQYDKLLNFYSTWVGNILTDNRLWWEGIYEVLEEYYAEKEFDKVRNIIDNYDKENSYMGGPELKSEFDSLRNKSLKINQPQNNKPLEAIKN